MKLVIIESPYAGDVELNLRYLRACLADCLARGEAPFASHGLYTQLGVLDDMDPAQRKLGIDAGFAWRRHADATVFYVDLGWSRGMKAAFDHTLALLRANTGHTIVQRRLGGEWAHSPAGVVEP